MELQTFIEDTLTQIITAVKNAAERTSDLGAKINPTLPPGQVIDTVQRLNMFESWNGELGDMVEFDLAVTASETSANRSGRSGGAGASVNIHVVAPGISGGRESESQTELHDSRISRVKFQVPVVLPHLPMPSDLGDFFCDQTNTFSLRPSSRDCLYQWLSVANYLIVTQRHHQ